MTTDTFELPPPGSDAEFYALANQAGLTYQQAKIALQYARQAALMERERCAKLAEDMDYGMGELASAIRNQP